MGYPLAKERSILNVGKLRKGSEVYYLNSVARGVEDYYTGSGEAPGYWLAGGANDMDLAGTVGEHELRAVLNGFHPRSDERLANGKTTKRQRVPGFDLTFRAPKSVSLLHALGDREASNQVMSAHDAAVAAAVAYLEREASGARRGKGGKTRIASKGFIGAAFRHRTSRAGDPLLHTHVLVANLVKGVDGKWGALDARQLYVHSKTAGYLYQAQLRYELTRRLGLEWDRVRNGAADLAGVPREVIRAFSKRRAEIEASVGEAQTSNAKATQLAAVTTRKAKDYDVTPEKLLPEWRDRAERLGLSEDDFADLVGRMPYRGATRADRERIGSELAGPEGLTQQSSSFTRRDAIQGVCNRLPVGAPIKEIERMADRFLASDLVLPLAQRVEGLTAKDSLRVSDGRVIPSGLDERRYSTEEMLSVERHVIERCIERRVDGTGTAQPRALEDALSARPSLFDDQKAMIGRLTTSGQGVEVVIGKAGAGKTFALDAAREAWESSGRRVVGCCLAARAAEELQAGSGIASFTIKGLLQDLDDPIHGGLAPGSVLVVDEAAMVGTRDLARLLDHAEVAQAKVVLVGDDKQLPPIDSGGAFRGIRNRLPAIELSEVRRQPDGWERDALDLVREGHAPQAMDAYLAHDRVVLARSATETRRRLISDWWATIDDDEPAVMLAARRSDVADLNMRARAVMAAAGKLGTQELDIAGTPFAVGDRVMTLKNTRWLGVKNGNRGTITALDQQLGEVVFRRDDGRSFTLPRSYLESGFLGHAYAMTGHKSQAMTTSKAFVLADQTLYREWAYVAMSRGRNDNRLYVVAGVDPDREEIGGEVAAIEDPLSEVIAAVGRSRSKDLALDSFEHEEIANMTMATLRDEWERLRTIVDGMPADPSGQRAQLQAERARVLSMLQRQRGIRRRAEEELDSSGKALRKNARTRRNELRAVLAEAQGAESSLARELQTIEGRRATIDERADARDLWMRANAPAVRRLDLVGRELWWREHQLALAAEVAMPGYLLDAVGECPMKPSERAAWHEAVRAIESYRRRWSIDDTEVALGSEVNEVTQTIERNAAQRRLDDLDIGEESVERDRSLGL